mmetsp:Transcript_149710/g.480728  ORF Transcript_149710/g.480728 Transcript_149710/m.480728 type:complete len:247 (+) Transcript_149710:1563-2303(+)
MRLRNAGAPERAGDRVHKTDELWKVQLTISVSVGHGPDGGQRLRTELRPRHQVPGLVGEDEAVVVPIRPLEERGVLPLLPLRGLPLRAREGSGRRRPRCISCRLCRPPYLLLSAADDGLEVRVLAVGRGPDGGGRRGARSRRGLRGLPRTSDTLELRKHVRLNGGQVGRRRLTRLSVGDQAASHEELLQVEGALVVRIRDRPYLMEQVLRKAAGRQKASGTRAIDEATSRVVNLSEEQLVVLLLLL